MCLIAFAWHAHPDYPLVVAGNRDEYFVRPTADAAWWPDGRMLAGFDLQAGGTWMGVSRAGRFAALTNFRDPAAVRAAAPSRGALVGAFVASDADAEDALAGIAGEASRFNGFNLLAGQWSGATGLWIASGPDGDVRAVAPGVHALSNARLDTPWPKAEAAATALATALDRAGDLDALATDLFAALADQTVAPDDTLPSTGVALATERALSAAFIRIPGYGTRASTVFVVDRDARVTFIERRFTADMAVAESRFTFATAARASLDTSRPTAAHR